MNLPIVAQPLTEIPFSPEAQLVLYENARKALKEARDIDEVKEIRNKTQAMAMYAKQAKDTAMARWVSEIKIRAERKCGEMLKETAKTGERATKSNSPGPGRGNKKVLHDVIPFKVALSDIGIEPIQSHRWQKMAAIPEEEFEHALQKSAEKTGIPTTSGVMKFAAELAEALRESAEIAADLKENSRRAKARNDADPTYQAVQQWSNLIGSVEYCLKHVNKILQASLIYPCPPDELDGLLKNWATVSDFISEYGCRHEHFKAN